MILFFNNFPKIFWHDQINKVIFSFLKHERFFNRFRVFIMNVLDHTTSLIVKCFWTSKIHDRFWAFMILYIKITNVRKLSKTLMERCKWSGMVNGFNAKGLGTFEPGRNNPLGRIVENFHGTFPFQKLKNDCTIRVVHT